MTSATTGQRMGDGRSIRDRFPPPWRIETTPGGCKVADAEGHALAYLYASHRPHDPQPTADECRAIGAVVCATANGTGPTPAVERFPGQWQAVDDDNTVRIVDERNRSIAYLYVGEPGAARPLTRAECRAIAAAVCRAASTNR